MKTLAWRLPVEACLPLRRIRTGAHPNRAPWLALLSAAHRSKTPLWVGYGRRPRSAKPTSADVPMAELALQTLATQG